MKIGYRIATSGIIIILIVISFMNIQKKNEYETYLKQENENSISSILSTIKSNSEILKNYEETDEITYAEFSRIGNACLNAEIELVDLQRQLKHYISEDEYSNDNFNTIIKYFDGVSMFISMDILKDFGNYYPHLYNDEEYELNEDEKLILGYMFNLNRRFIDLIEEKGFINNQTTGKEYDIDVDNNNGLGDLIDLIDAMANESNNYLGELESLENSKFVEEFFLKLN